MLSCSGTVGWCLLLEIDLSGNIGRIAHVCLEALTVAVERAGVAARPAVEISGASGLGWWGLCARPSPLSYLIDHDETLPDCGTPLYEVHGGEDGDAAEGCCEFVHGLGLEVTLRSCYDACCLANKCI